MMPGRVTDLTHFRGEEAIGTKGEIHKLTMARLDAGDAAFVVQNNADETENNFTVEGRIEHVIKKQLDRKEKENSFYLAIY